MRGEGSHYRPGACALCSGELGVREVLRLLRVALWPVCARACEHFTPLSVLESFLCSADI